MISHCAAIFIFIRCWGTTPRPIFQGHILLFNYWQLSIITRSALARYKLEQDGSFNFSWWEFLTNWQTFLNLQLFWLSNKSMRTILVDRVVVFHPSLNLNASLHVKNMEMLVMYWLLSLETDAVTRVQIKDEFNYTSQTLIPNGKCMNIWILPPAICK